MTERTLAVALVHEVFVGERGADRLDLRAREAREAGAEIVLLPELPMTRWVPATRRRAEADAEDPGGQCQQRMSAAARKVGIALHGGAIVRDPETGRRYSRAMLFDATGRLLATYDKLHLPHEEGFWETDHYQAGSYLTPPSREFGLRIGMQVCSDVQRPTLSHVLAAMGAELILAPRATPRVSYERWLTVLRANAITSATYVISVNRPGPETGVPIGGPSVAIAPDGAVLVATEAPMTVIQLERSAVETARRDYPGYLAVRSGLYARCWAAAESPPA